MHALSAGVAQPASAAPGLPYANPIKSQKGADPWLEYYNGNYYLITTTFTNKLLMRKSPTLAGLATAPSVQVWEDSTSSRGTNFWAPEIHFIDNRWYLYYSGAQVGAPCCDTQRTHVLESAGWSTSVAARYSTSTPAAPPTAPTSSSGRG
ncbi:family 43 glycosylhydrolase [Nonomuraea rubra]|uniref:GH43 family beta-xylosidase n=1 Tax=Nonomuraea rubra TaxID=46180 RepID=A0A7X0NPK9_9ACTN|nr:family 43 glycosylhydrolase [Nonomuraea rubra]MBB6547086.1 GH43 family beta-xylosidase [Nonomuraea rubra]